MAMDYKKDSHTFGALSGLTIPVISYLIFIGIALLVQLFIDFNIKSIYPALKLAAIAINLLPIRYYFVSLKYELTGRGLLLVTFVYVIVYFWLFN